MGRSGCIKIALCLPRVVSRTAAQLQAPSALCRELAIERSKQKDGNPRSVGPGGDRARLEVVCSIRVHCGEYDTGGKNRQSPAGKPSSGARSDLIRLGSADSPTHIFTH